MNMVYISVYLGFLKYFSIELYCFLHTCLTYISLDLFRGTAYFDATLSSYAFDNLILSTVNRYY